MNPALISWRPFTHMKTALDPINIVHAQGAAIFDDNGARYLDAISSWWVITHGHCHPHIVRSVQKVMEDLDQIVFANFTHAPARKLLEALRVMLPRELCSAFFSDNGSTSVEVALKMALQYWKLKGSPRNKVVAFKGAYHGDTAGCMSVSARGIFTAPYEKMLFEVVRFEDAHTSLAEDTAALIIEPLVQGAGGMIMWDQAHLQEVLRVARMKDIVVIFDEVMTGFFRTGTCFAFEALQFVPDILCLSKGLTGGLLPLALTICNERIYQGFLESENAHMFFHGHTFTANPISCAAAVANLELMNDDVKLQVQNISQIHAARMEKLSHPLIKAKRMCGTIAAIEIHGYEGYLSQQAHVIARASMHHGVFLRPIGNVIYLMPPYCISDDDLNHIWDVVVIAIEELASTY